jgi:hypothetical protein
LKVRERPEESIMLLIEAARVAGVFAEGTL